MHWANAAKAPAREDSQNMDPGQTWGLAMKGGIDGVDSCAIAVHVDTTHRITRRRWPAAGRVFDYTGLRVTPNVTHAAEVDVRRGDAGRDQERRRTGTPRGRTNVVNCFRSEAGLNSEF
jgi:hypothetical protein